MEGDAFSGFHPAVNLLYFAAVLGFALFLLHPAAIALSFLCAASYALYVKGKKALRFGLIFMLPVLLITALMNPLFNHRGVTVLFHLPNGNPVTFESMLYGIAAAGILITVIAWFSCFNAVMTGDKFIYVFGRIIPAISLILSMALRFVPLFARQVKIIAAAQKGMSRESGKTLVQKARYGMKIISVLVTWALENAVETADSMKNRGYGLPGRSAFSIFTFRWRDGYALLYMLTCTALLFAGAARGAVDFRYFPSIAGGWAGWETAAFLGIYAALGAFPLILNINEARYWKRVKPSIASAV